MSEYHKEYYIKNRDRLLQKAKDNYDPVAKSAYDKKRSPQKVKQIQEWRDNFKAVDPAGYMHYTIKARAKKDGTPFFIEPCDIIIPEYCPVLGLPLTFNSGRPQDNSPSLDRINPDLGYVKGNVRVISYRANTLKNNASMEELLAVVEYMRQCLM